MRNTISKFSSPRRLKIPFISLLLAVSGIGLSLVDEQNKLALSNQIKSFSKATALAVDAPTWENQSQSHSKTSILVRLRQHREERSQLRIASLTEKNLEKSKQQQLAKSTSVIREMREVPVRTGLVSTPSLSNSTKTVAQNPKDIKKLPSTNIPQADGIYLYGQSPQPNQMGIGYILFQKQQNKVIGALYMPKSEFSCFQGTIDQSGELAMTVTDSTGGGETIQVATGSRIPQVTEDDFINYAYSVTLQNYHQLTSLTANDQKILQICRSQYSDGYYTKLVK